MITNHVTSLELSKQLIEAGIVVESEFYWVKQDENDGKFLGDFWKEWQLLVHDQAIDSWGEDLDGRGAKPFTVRDCIKNPSEFWFVYPAPLSSELGELLPEEIVVDDDTYYLHQDKNFINYRNPENIDADIWSEIEGNEANARAKMLLYLKSKELL